MSRYVEKNHGLIIGSDNVFFFKDDADEAMREFRSIVWAKRYKFTQINSVNCQVRTPAEQIIWHPREETWEEPFKHNGKTIMLPRARVLHDLNPYLRQWLNTNAPGWGIPAINDRSNSSVFFTRRGHAVAFVRHIESLLDGMGYI